MFFRVAISKLRCGRAPWGILRKRLGYDVSYHRMITWAILRDMYSSASRPSSASGYTVTFGDTLIMVDSFSRVSISEGGRFLSFSPFVC